MRQHSSSIGILAIACGLLTNASAAQAAIETWVSGTGTDAGACPITAPCRTFAYAHGQTNANGAINVLSSGNFGPVTITKPISIVADGVEAVINSATAASGGAGIVVQAPTGAVVSLRGLTIDLRGSTTNNGVTFVSGAALHVHNCTMRRMGNGIEFGPTSGSRELYVADSAFETPAVWGVAVVPTNGASANAVLNRVRVENGFGGVMFQGSVGPVTGTVRDSVFAGLVAMGIASQAVGGSSVVMVDRSATVKNDVGIWADGAGATIRVGDSTLTANTKGLSITNGASILSYGTNKVNANTAGENFSGTIIGMK